MKHRPAGPLLESLLVPDGASWMYFRRRLDGGIPFKWHYHVEYEITLTVNSSGLRYVGDTIEPYGDGDLVLLGSNLPHTWMSQDRMNAADPHVVHVFWIRPDWIHALAETVEELRPVKGLLLNASRGLVFSATTARAVRALAEDLHAVTAPPARLVRFIELLTLLAQDRDPRPLCVCRADLATPTGGDRHRLDRTLEHIHQHYTGEISLPHLASLAALSVSGLHRLFKRHTRMTVGGVRRAAAHRQGVLAAGVDEQTHRAHRGRRRLRERVPVQSPVPDDQEAHAARVPPLLPGAGAP